MSEPGAEMWTVGQAAAYLKRCVGGPGTSASTVQRMVDSGRLLGGQPAPGQRRSVDPDDVMLYARQRRGDPDALELRVQLHARHGRTLRLA